MRLISDFSSSLNIGKTGINSIPFIRDIPEKIKFCNIEVSANVSVDDTIGIVTDYFEADFYQYKRSRCLLITFANPYTLYLGEKDSDFRRLLRNFDMVLVDGIALVYAIQKICHIKLERISFDSSSLALHIFEAARRCGWSVILVGGRDSVAEGAAAQIVRYYPGLHVVACFDGYQPIPNLVEHIRCFGRSLVICGMGPNNQEHFLVSLQESGWEGVGISCGGYFDQLQNGISYYPKWVNRLNLRWLYRLVSEPGRLWRRYFVIYPASAILILKYAARIFKRTKLTKP
jgi:N-acetylglucosaminyldiphosphoundecaprenol N-acetyl-beta-D-mannosaminyltransferase